MTSDTTANEFSMEAHPFPGLEPKGDAAEGGFQDFFQQSATAILLVEEDGQIVDANRLAVDLLGRSRHDLSSCRVGRIFPDLRDARWAELCGKTTLKDWVRFKTTGMNAEDKPFSVRLSCVRFNRPGGGTRLALFLDDQSAEARQREELRRFLVELSQMAHSLGQPATILLSSLELMTQVRTRNPETLDNLIPMSLAAAEQLQSLLRRMNALRHAYHRIAGLDRIQAGQWVDGP